jgi:DnaJ-class molecular chaperone
MAQCKDCEGARYDYCGPCRGSGHDIQDCHSCKGAGGQYIDVHGAEHWEPCGACRGEGRYDGTCGVCNGTGSIESHCSKCGGSGYLPESAKDGDEDDGRYIVDIDDSDSD